MEIKEFEEAAHRLRNVIHRIPVSASSTFSGMTGSELYLKCENQQKTGSFKVRGAYNKIAKRRASENPPPAVVASSAGNHAQGVAYAASQLGIQSTIVMPRTAPIAKISATEGYGAQIVLHGDYYDDAYQKALDIQHETGAEFIHPFDDEDVIAGQGTIGLEILQDLPAVDVVIVPAGGGGLLAGIACCIKQVNPRVRIVGVQAEGADALVRSFNSKKKQTSDSVATFADGIAVKNPGDKTFALISQYVDEMVTVSDAQIATSILHLIERCKQIVEPAGASALAAALFAKTDIKGKKVVCLLSGGNIDVSLIHRVVERGLVERGRQLQFQTLLKDVPGSLSRFSEIVCSEGANIVMIQHDRVKEGLRLNEAILHTVCEVGSKEHGQRVLESLKKQGYSVQLTS